MQHLLFFGRTPQLALAEVTSLGISVTAMTPEIGVVSGSSAHIDGKDMPLSGLLSVLGGTVKIAKAERDVLPDITAADIADVLTERGDRSSLTFGISWHVKDAGYPRKLLPEIKDIVEKHTGSRVRFIEPRSGSVLSSAVVHGQGVLEIHVVPVSNGYIVAKTVSVQDIEEWSRRDYGRPYADPKAGMLPPKVARMVVNIGLGADARGKTCMDPFCGMGTILGEALEREGVQIIGSDVDGDAVRKASKNMEWLTRTGNAVRMFTCDATHISDVVGQESLDAIITEPYMGPTSLAERGSKESCRAANIFKGLEKLYIGCFREWRSVVKKGGKVVMALPSFYDGKRKISVKNIVDTCEKLGYTKLLGPLPYSRPQATVGREFYVFEKK